jgi:hypothetical protein
MAILSWFRSIAEVFVLHLNAATHQAHGPDQYLAAMKLSGMRLGAQANRQSTSMHKVAKATSPSVTPTPRSRIVRMTSLFAVFGRDGHRHVTPDAASFLNVSVLVHHGHTA